MSVRPVPRPPAMSAVLRQRKWRSGGPPPKSGGPPQFGGPRTAATLALLLVLSLCANFALMFYHDEVVLGLHSLEEAHMELGDAPDWSEGSMHIDMGTEEDWSRGARSHYSMEPREILKRAGVDPDAGYVPSLTVSQANAAASKRGPDFKQAARLPPLADIQAMYGNRTRILGLEQCAAFRAAIPPADRVMGPAGIFNSATNLLNKLLQLNCVNEARVKAHKGKLRATGMMLQAPWGKHNPVPWRLHHEAVQGGKLVPHQEDFLPIVMIKDPITWMSSMCRHPYEARWRHNNAHCPNLVPNEHDRGRTPGEGTMALRVKFATKHMGDGPRPGPENRTWVDYDSLVQLWNDWYNEWRAAPFPRLMVRFEDLLFHAEETVAAACECGGGTLRPRFKYVEDSAKGSGGPHAGSAGFLASLVTYGNRTLRNEGILTERWDRDYAREHLDATLMETFGYAPLPAPTRAPTRRWRPRVG